MKVADDSLIGYGYRSAVGNLSLEQSGMTDPALPSTFPNRVALYFTFPWVLALCTIISHILFVAPITLVGFTALSVDTIMKRSAPYSSHSSTRVLGTEYVVVDSFYAVVLHQRHVFVCGRIDHMICG